MPVSRLHIPDLVAMKGHAPIVCLTAYAAPIARLLDAHIDCFIVGDSLGMVCYGQSSTLGVSVDTMIRHGRTVVEHSQRACVMIDMPFGSYQASPEDAFHHAARIICETGAQAVKLEGGEEMAETVMFLVRRGIPVMAHIGLKPQHYHTMGGYKYQGRDEAGRAQLLADAYAMVAAGAFGLLLEGLAEPVAREITQSMPVPTIGIGASPQCDGQVLVTDDLLGLTPSAPRFAKRYAKLDETISQAVQRYSEDVRNRHFPELAHCFGVKKS